MVQGYDEYKTGGEIHNMGDLRNTTSLRGEQDDEPGSDIGISGQLINQE